MSCLHSTSSKVTRKMHPKHRHLSSRTQVGNSKRPRNAHEFDPSLPPRKVEAFVVVAVSCHFVSFLLCLLRRADMLENRKTKKERKSSDEEGELLIDIHTVVLDLFVAVLLTSSQDTRTAEAALPRTATERTSRQMAQQFKVLAAHDA